MVKKVGATFTMDASSQSRRRRDLTMVGSVAVAMVVVVLVVVVVVVDTQQSIKLQGTQPTSNQLRKRMSAMDTVVIKSVAGMC